MNSMLAVSNKPKSGFISRIFTDKAGRSFRLTFLVAVVDGELKGRLVSAEPLSLDYAQLPGQVVDGSFCLPVFCRAKKPETAFIPAYVPIVSPYIELYFFTSQPTRAPSRS